MQRGLRNRYQTRGSGVSAAVETEVVLHWGNRKRLRCVKSHRIDSNPNLNSNTNVLVQSTSPRQRLLRNSEAMTAVTKTNVTSKAMQGDGGSSSGDDKAVATGSGGGSSSGGEEGIWPKFTIGLTNKEKEEDFLVLKGSKLPQRPKKRTKLIQKTVNLVSPGTWLCDLTLERYEVREKKTSKKKPRGLKSMGSMESDSE